MKGSEYIRRVFHEVTRAGTGTGDCTDGVFLAAALEVMREVESPLKEEALVRLAVIESDAKAPQYRPRLRA
jgi:hypothetical protein